VSPRLEQHIFAEFPALFRTLRDPVEPATWGMRRWGIQCDDGWLRLIRECARETEERARRFHLDPDDEEWPKVFQIKEKCGTLRFYLFFPITGYSDIRDKYRELSEKVDKATGSWRGLPECP
jgi:hypothetical protein